MDITYEEVNGIQELNLNEIEEVNGGCGGLCITAVIVGVILAANFIAGAIDGARNNANQTQSKD